jgi:hypothetical protein
MRMRADLAIAFVAALALPADAEPLTATCAELTSALQSVEGYSFRAPPAAPVDDWCVLDGAVLTATRVDRPTLSAEHLRLRGSTEDGALASLEIDIGGLRVSPKAGDRAMDDRLRAMFRLQTADMHLSVARNAGEDRLELRGGEIRLSGGTEVSFGADIQGAELSMASLLGGSLTALDLDWRNDGRLLRPAMEAAGERLVQGATGSGAVDAARRALTALADSLPGTLFAADARAEIEQLVAALPQGRGRLRLSLTSEDGIGAARVAVAALSRDPLGPDAMARIFDESHLQIDWQPGLAP